MFYAICYPYTNTQNLTIMFKQTLIDDKKL